MNLNPKSVYLIWLRLGNEMIRNIAPIALFVYNRLSLTKQTVSALVDNKYAPQSDLFVYSDGYKNEKDLLNVYEVRKYIRSIVGFKSVTIIEREHNYGLARSIISGVTELINLYGRIIVMEDDLVSSSEFLSYMNDALDYYADEEKVICIHGYTYPVAGKLPNLFFLRGADCWGWGTWKRGWDLFEEDGNRLLKLLRDRNLVRDFDKYFTTSLTQMLVDQINGKNDSWAIRWIASAFLEEKLTLYPAKSMIKNIGCDNSGTHCGSTSVFDVNIENPDGNIIFPEPVENKIALNEIRKYFDDIRPGFFARLYKYAQSNLTFSP